MNCQPFSVSGKPRKLMKWGKISACYEFNLHKSQITESMLKAKGIWITISEIKGLFYRLINIDICDSRTNTVNLIHPFTDPIALNIGTIWLASNVKFSKFQFNQHYSYGKILSKREDLCMVVGNTLTVAITILLDEQSIKGNIF